MTITLAQKPTLAGKRVLLRPVNADDTGPLLAAMRDPETQRLTGSHPQAYDSDPETQRRAVEEWYRTRHDHDDRLDLAIVEQDSGECAGEVVLNEFSAEDASCNLRIMIVPRWTGHGLGSEAISLLLDHAFGTVGLHRVSLGVYAFNPRARHVYEKVGFRLEGTLRDALRWDDRYVDEHVMAVLATDPRP
ncbi:MAG TPA: GNAT family protein [Actinocatenispora sp.]